MSTFGEITFKLPGYTNANATTNTWITSAPNLVSVGTLTTGVWNATVINPTYGGTGVNNGSSTITIAGNISTANSLTTSGNFPLTLTTTGSTNVTLPTSGTLVNTAVTTLSSLVSIGTITTGTWNATIITGTYGGTGVNNGSNTITLGGNINTANSFTTSGNFALTLTTTASTNVTLPTSGTLVNTAVTTLSSLVSIGTITTGTWTATTIGIAYGGTGQTTLPTNGQLLIGGSTSSNFVLGTLTAGTGISITNSNNSITINNTSASSISSEWISLANTYFGAV